jgi:hypothetical protein
MMMHALPKGLLAIFNLTQQIRGEARIVDGLLALTPMRSRRPSQSSMKDSTPT